MIDIKYELKKIQQKLVMFIVWMLPKWVIYYSTIRLIAYATTGKYGTTIVPELKAMEALKRWEDKWQKD